jgi:hypothetical protein
VTQYLVLAALIATLISGVGGYAAGRKDGRALERGEQDRAAVAVESSAALAREAIATAISEIEVKNVHTTQRIEKETVEKPVSQMSDPSFGATTRKLKQVVDQYYVCRAAATQSLDISKPVVQDR